MEREAKKKKKQICESISKTNKKKLGFLDKLMCTQEQACVHRQDYVYASFYLETLEIEQRLKTLNQTS